MGLHVDTPEKVTCHECCGHTSRCVKLLTTSAKRPSVVLCWSCFKPYAYGMSEAPASSVIARDVDEVHFSYPLLEDLRAKGMLRRLAPQGVQLQAPERAQQYDTITGEITECVPPCSPSLGIENLLAADRWRDMQASIFGGLSDAPSVFASTPYLGSKDLRAAAHAFTQDWPAVTESTTHHDSMDSALPLPISSCATSTDRLSADDASLRGSSSLLGSQTDSLDIEQFHQLCFGPGPGSGAGLPPTPCAMDAVFNTSARMVDLCS